MLIIVADLDKFFRTKKGKVIFFPNNIILNKKHNTYLSLMSLINEKVMFQTKIYMLDIYSTQMHHFIQLKTNKHTSSTCQPHHMKISFSSIKSKYKKNQKFQTPSTPSDTHKIWQTVTFFTWPELHVIHENFKNYFKVKYRYISTSYFYTLKKITKIIKFLQVSPLY